MYTLWHVQLVGYRTLFRGHVLCKWPEVFNKIENTGYPWICDLNSLDHMLYMATCCLENAWHINCICKYWNSGWLFFGSPFNWWPKNRFVCWIRICGEIYMPTAGHVVISKEITTWQLHVNFGYFSFSGFKCTVYSKNPARFTLKLNYKHWLYKLFCSSRNENRTAYN